jgi:hypothetical protein
MAQFTLKAHHEIAADRNTKETDLHNNATSRVKAPKLHTSTFEIHR